MFVNGVQVSSRAVSASVAVGTGALRIGGNAIWSEWFSGLIDEVRVYDRALAAQDIHADMAAPGHVRGGARGPQRQPDRAVLQRDGRRPRTQPPRRSRSPTPGDGTLNWTATDDADWLTVSPGSGTDAGTLTVTASAAGLAAGTYRAEVTVGRRGHQDGAGHADRRGGTGTTAC